MNRADRSGAFFASNRRASVAAGAWLVFAALTTLSAADPVVTNVVASQRPATKLVDVWFDVSDGVEPLFVAVVFSKDNGATWDVVPAPEALSGDVGTGITNGAGKHIVWAAGRDRPDVYWPQTGVKVLVTESNPPLESVTLNLPGDVPLVMVKIPAGSFEMGVPDTERGSGSLTSPVHTVIFSRAFYIGKYEVTQRQWLALMATNPSLYTGDLDLPVDSVSWNKLTATDGFLDKLTQHLTATGQGDQPVRLPSEAEWEYACRAGTTTRFFFGDSLSVDDGVTDGPTDSAAYPGNRSDYMWFSANSGGTPHVVGQKQPNAWGLFDMSGNVQEWCQDFFHGGYTGAPTDGSAWETPQHIERMFRGGAFNLSALGCRSGSRWSDEPSESHELGVRIARTFLPPASRPRGDVP